MSTLQKTWGVHLYKNEQSSGGRWGCIGAILSVGAVARKISGHTPVYQLLKFMFIGST